MTELEKAEKALVTAREELSAIQRKKRAVSELFLEGITAANKKVMAAKLAADKAKFVAAYHPWTGKKVCRVSKRTTAWNFVKDVKTDYGIIEICGPQTRFPANTSSWRLPATGATFVRLLKKDGTPGLGFDCSIYEWKLVEKIDE